MAPLASRRRTRFQFTYKLIITDRVKGKCEPYPRYSPERDGLGGCSTCFSLVELSMPGRPSTLRSGSSYGGRRSLDRLESQVLGRMACTGSKLFRSNRVLAPVISVRWSSAHITNA